MNLLLFTLYVYRRGNERFHDVLFRTSLSFEMNLIFVSNENLPLLKYQTVQFGEILLFSFDSK